MSSEDQNSKAPGEITPDDTDRIQQEWALTRPDLPLRSIGVITRIWRIAKLLTDDRRRTMKQLGMEPAIRDLLANLRRSDAPYRLRVSELATRCGVSKSAITQRVARAEADGLVQSKHARSMPDEMINDIEDNNAFPTQKDQRAVWVELTPKGRDMVETTVETLLRHEDALIDELGDEEIANLSDTLRRLLHSLEHR